MAFRDISEGARKEKLSKMPSSICLGRFSIHAASLLQALSA
jgi:hypothetical protein